MGCHDEVVRTLVIQVRIWWLYWRIITGIWGSHPSVGQQQKYRKKKCILTLSTGVKDRSLRPFCLTIMDVLKGIHQNLNYIYLYIYIYKQYLALLWTIHDSVIISPQGFCEIYLRRCHHALASAPGSVPSSLLEGCETDQRNVPALF